MFIHLKNDHVWSYYNKLYYGQYIVMNHSVNSYIFKPHMLTKQGGGSGLNSEVGENASKIILLSKKKKN